MNQNRTVNAFLFGLACVFGLMMYASMAAGPVYAADKIELNFWHAKASARGKVWNKIVDAFNKAHPDIHVTASYQGGYTATLQKITTAIAAGATPDVTEIPNRYGTPQFADSGKMIPLNRFMSKEEIEDIYEGVRVRFMWKGKLWAIPNATSTTLLYYNADMFKEVGLNPDKPPATWEELVDAGKKLTRDLNGDGKIDKWGLVTHTTTNYFLYALIFQNGGKLLSGEGEPLFTSKEAIEACQFWAVWVHKYKIMPPLAHQPANKLFASGTAGMMWNSTSFLTKLEKQIGNRFDVRVAFLPKNKERGTDLGGTGLSIFKSNTKQEEAAWAFVKWVTSPKWAAYWSENTGYVMTTKSARKLKSHQEFLKANPQYNIAAEQMPYAGVMPASKADSITYKQFSKLAQKLEADANVDIPKELAKMATEVKEKLK